ncbi:hypothetical protein EIN43_04810 [Enterobacter hormaechei]|uniref:Uncharacterized protein n=1 Tax=Enterobacter hormaechei TaxID=158836 RepID=A0A4Y5ZNE4_9ENTR|nr:hypothetical protein EIN43_04810 [Enterobacter hormaechei]
MTLPSLTSAGAIRTPAIWRTGITTTVRIIDRAGNVGSTTSQVVTVDTTPPDTVGTVVSYTTGRRTSGQLRRFGGNR